MVKRGVARRGEVWLAALDPTVGSEIQKTRPCLIVSPDELNTALRTVIVAPMTTGSHPAPFRVAVKFQGKSGLILTEQLGRLTRRVWSVAKATSIRGRWRRCCGC